jgi:hypothetical protein
MNESQVSILAGDNLCGRPSDQKNHGNAFTGQFAFFAVKGR